MKKLVTPFCPDGAVRLHEMAMLEEASISTVESVRRVPGGWVFTGYDHQRDCPLCMVFVPEPKDERR